MTKLGVLASVVVCLLPLSFFMGTQTATAKQCNVAMPSKPKAHWSYRLIDGRKMLVRRPEQSFEIIIDLVRENLPT